MMIMLVWTDAWNGLIWHNLTGLGLPCPKCRRRLIRAAEDCNRFGLPTWAICVERRRGMSDSGFQHGEQRNDTSSRIQNKTERVYKKFHSLSRGHKRNVKSFLNFHFHIFQLYLELNSKAILHYFLRQTSTYSSSYKVWIVKVTEEIYFRTNSRICQRFCCHDCYEPTILRTPPRNYVPN
jgi:hypothetical protein